MLAASTRKKDRPPRPATKATGLRNLFPKKGEEHRKSLRKPVATVAPVSICNGRSICALCQYSKDLEKPMQSPDAASDEELVIFVERLRHFMNLWTIYSDILTGKYVPSVGAEEESVFNPKVTVMLLLHAYLYSLIEDSDDGLNAFRIWRKHFPEEEPAIRAIEAQIVPFRNDLRVFRNRLGFHGSRTRVHEASGLDLFANFTGGYAWEAIKNFKALAAMLLGKEIARSASDEANLKKYGS
jgi:hypothetical protein